MAGGSPKNRNTSQGPDGGYGWFILGVTFLLNIMMLVPFVAFGILYVAYSRALQESKAVIGWIGSVFSFMSMTSGLFIASFVVRFGCRPVGIIGAILISFGLIISTFAANVYYLYISYGFIGGCGFGIINFVGVIIVQEYFTEKRALAGGIALAGQPLGAFIGSLLTRFWIETYGWRNTMLLIGGVTLHTIPLVTLFRPYPKPSAPNVPKFTCSGYFLTIFDFSMMLRLDFILFSLCSVSAFFGFSMYYLNLPSRAVSVNLTFEQASWLPPIISLSSFVARVMLSWVANLKCTNRLVMYTVLPLVSGIVSFTSGLSYTFPYVAINAALFGCLVGSMLSIQPACEVDMFGKENLTKAHSLLGLWFGIATLIATPLAGFIYDTTKSYDIPFYLVGAVQHIGFLAMSFCLIRRKLQSRTPTGRVLVDSNAQLTNTDVQKVKKEALRPHVLSMGSEMGSVPSIHDECKKIEELPSPETQTDTI